MRLKILVTISDSVYGLVLLPTTQVATPRLVLGTTLIVPEHLDRSSNETFEFSPCHIVPMLEPTH